MKRLPTVSSAVLSAVRNYNVLIVIVILSITASIFPSLRTLEPAPCFN